MAWFDALAGVGDFLTGLFKTGYDVYQDQRDTQYQHELQQTVFNREDTAVQRRMADLQAAGLNPNLAAGSAAGVGSVVGRSAAHNISDPGSALDMVSAVNTLKMQRQQIDNARKEGEILETQRRAQDLYFNIDQMSMLNQLGFSINPIYRDNHKGDGVLEYSVGGNLKLSNLGNYLVPSGTNLIALQNELAARNLLNSSNMLQFDADFYKDHQIFKNFVQPIISAGIQGGATAAKMYAAFGPK